MKGQLRTLLKGSTAIWSIMTIVLTIISLFYHPIRTIYPFVYIPLIVMLTTLALTERNLSFYRMSALLTTLGIALLLLAIASYYHFNESVFFFISYYILIISGVIYAIQIKPTSEKDINYFSDVRNLPPLFLTLTAPLTLAFGIHLFLTISKSDFVLAKFEAYRLEQNESSLINPEALKQLYSARTFAASNNHSAALERLQAALDLEPKNDFLHYALYFTFRSLHNLDEAKQHINKAIELNPEATNYLCEKTYLLLQNNETDQAKAVCEKASTIDPHCPETLFLKAQISMFIDSMSPDKAYAYLDSSYYYCNTRNLKYRLKQFKTNNCGLKYYLNKMTPYQLEMLTQNLSFYYDQKSLFNNSHIEIDKENKTPRMGKDRTMIGVKNFIRLFHDSFKDEEVSFAYYMENNQRHLIIILQNNTWISADQLKELFKSDQFSTKVKVNIVTDNEFKYL